MMLAWLKRGTYDKEGICTGWNHISEVSMTIGPVMRRPSRLSRLIDKRVYCYSLKKRNYPLSCLDSPVSELHCLVSAYSMKVGVVSSK